jgi:uncharacterized protein YjiS (DUF1127 family)
MLPVSAGRDVLLTSPCATQPDRTARSTNGTAVLFAAMRHVLFVLSAWQRRSAGRRLTELDDYLLHDIGLTRADVEMALPKPFGRGPISSVPGFLTPGAWRC